MKLELPQEWFEKNLSHDNVDAGVGVPPRLKPETVIVSVEQGQVMGDRKESAMDGMTPQETR